MEEEHKQITIKPELDTEDITTTAKKPPAKKSKPNKNNDEPTKHIKRRVLEFLEKNGCTRQSLELAATATRRTDYVPSILNYFTTSYAKAEEFLKGECDSVSLHNINEWLQLMETTELSKLCEYEAAAILNSIVRNEPQPKPEDLNGINMSEVYKFLENALTGQPQKKLSEASHTFLAREIELLIAEANTDHSDDVARGMGQHLYNYQNYNYAAQPHKCSLDPLFLDEWRT